MSKTRKRKSAEEAKAQNDKEIKQLNERVIDLEDKWKRAVADYRNLERRTKKDQEAVTLFSKALLLVNFLPIFDNLEIAQKTLKDSGVELIAKQFEELLTREGVSEIECAGKKFDPLEMEAMGVVEGKEGKVMEVTQKGYKLGDRVLRPARVKVGKAK